MAPIKDDIREIEARATLERRLLVSSVSEISRRLQPRHLVDVTTQYAKHKVAGVIGGVSDSIKENGGTAAAVALGAVAVFDAGRRSAEVDNSRRDLVVETAAPETHFVRKIPEGAKIPYEHRTVTNYARANTLAGSVVGLMLGHIIGRSFEPTAKERELFGKASGEAQDSASEFINQHLHGAKLVAAQAFGFAKYSAAFLAIMAAVSEHLGRPADQGDPPPKWRGQSADS